MRLGKRGKAPVPASFDQQGGQSGKIHFIESISLQNIQFWGSGEETGDACAPLGGLTCTWVVGSEPLGFWSGTLLSRYTLVPSPIMPCSALAWFGGQWCLPTWLPPSLHLFCRALPVAVSGLWTTRSALSGIGPISLGSCLDTTGHGRSTQSKAAAGSAAAASAILFPRVPASIPWWPSSPSWP